MHEEHRAPAAIPVLKVQVHIAEVKVSRGNTRCCRRHSEINPWAPFRCSPFDHSYGTELAAEPGQGASCPREERLEDAELPRRKRLSYWSRLTRTGNRLTRHESVR